MCVWGGGGGGGKKIKNLFKKVGKLTEHDFQKRPDKKKTRIINDGWKYEIISHLKQLYTIKRIIDLRDV